MAEQQNQNDEKTAGISKEGGTTFKREGPAPAEKDSGRNVEEMNRAAEDSLVRNVTPDEQTD
jgi:hypothetical protein